MMVKTKDKEDVLQIGENPIEKVDESSDQIQGWWKVIRNTHSDLLLQFVDSKQC